MDLISPLILIIILIFSAILHEIAHGLMAERLGDPTARLRGRLTLNPIPHIDPIFSILMPLVLILSGSSVLFGGAKPVPVDPFNLRDGRKDIALVSLAGPLTNLLIAIIGSIVLHLLSFLHVSSFSFFPILLFFLLQVIQINVILAIFNLLPIPPLDGSKIFALILPERDARAYLSLSSIGVFIILFLLMSPVGSFSLSALINNLVVFTLKLIGL